MGGLRRLWVWWVALQEKHVALQLADELENYRSGNMWVSFMIFTANTFFRDLTWPIINVKFIVEDKPSFVPDLLQIRFFGI